MAKYEHFLGLGIAGNFALHLDQAGEAEDFKDVITADEAAPKGIFPFYLPNAPKEKKSIAKEILYTYPLSSDTLQLPNRAVNVQAEPEVGLICSLEFMAGKLINITPTHFGAYNDASIRVKGANKISDKKNWGKNSKGLANHLFEIDTFQENGIMDRFSICSFLRRDGEINAYGEDVELTGYSYFHTKLTEWILHQINTQEDFGPLEAINEYIADSSYPTQAIISIGATRYTEYGENTFLKSGDEVLVVVYDRDFHTLKNVQDALYNSEYSTEHMSVLAQKVH